MKVSIFNSQKALYIKHRAITRFVKALLEYLQVRCDEIALHFVNTDRICELHEKYFNDPTPTDCITFPLDEEEEFYRVLGEVFICADTAKEYAHAHEICPFEELSLYIIHGILHLIGYDDIEKSKRAVMRKKEKECIQFLKDNHLILYKQAG